MAEAPQTHTPAWKKASEGFERHRSEDGTHRQNGSNRYSHRQYRGFRERMRKRQRSIDEERVHQIYQDMETRSFKSYMHWLGQKHPLCVQCLEEGKIQPGRVLDHITPIERGGSVYDGDNLQWLCDHHHNIKRATEDKQ